ncbi:MAG: rlmB [Gammaproteobacteria bacterium]|jgi:23S rRNA (guanosine2251-2'-O)-methyltransferase|nr:rlmB [Gammaproteobacteria bacterium]
MSESTVVFGLHAVEVLLKKCPERIHCLNILSERHDPRMQLLLKLAQQHAIKIQFMSRVTLDQLSHQANHQGIIAFCHPARRYAEQDLPQLLRSLSGPAFLLILDGVQDPHNLGACLRSADAAGVHAVIAPKDKSVGLTPTVCKVACGAAETVPFIQVTNLARTLRFLKEQNIWLFGAAGEAPQNLYQTNLNMPLGIVLGAEGAGMRRLTREHCDVLVYIPMRGTVPSLNVSVATGIVLFETVRQRALKIKY